MRRRYCDLWIALVWVIASVSTAAAVSVEPTDRLQVESEQLLRHAALTGAGYSGGRISREFAEFAGSADNADNLVSGLRHGGSISLFSGRGNVTFAVPTPPMGDADIYLGLALARQGLLDQGIVAPTPQQIKARLIGGGAVPGVLTQRRRGMGWPAIARMDGGTLAPVIDGMRDVNRDLAMIAAHLSASGAW